METTINVAERSQKGAGIIWIGDLNRYTTKGSIAFLFDLDGVLIDSEREYTRIWDAIDKSHPTGVDGFTMKIKGKTLHEILDGYFKPSDHRSVVSMLDCMEQAMHYDWLPGSQDLLKELLKRDIPTALVTSSNGMKMQHLHDELPELEGYFHTIVTADKISKSKPDPEGYLLAARELGMEPSRCVVVEDSVQGVRAGNASGAYVIGLTTTLSSESIREYCDLVISDLSELFIPPGNR